MKYSMSQKKTQKIHKTDLPQRLSQARGDSPIDILIKNVQLLDVITGEIYPTCVAIGGDTIVGVGLEYENSSALRIFDGKEQFIVPGFIDSHLHIESSMMSPFEFEKITLPIGTTTIICDPHEITNVIGEKGFEWFLRCSEMTKQNLFIQVSSCVPALPGYETNGSDFKIDQMKKYHDHPSVLGLAEMMNFPGVINGNEEVLEKIEAFSDLNLDGHAPLLRGKQLNAYLVAGIQNCHETVTFEEGKEKLRKGMGVILREGSVAKNLKTLSGLVNEFSSVQCLLCTDDRNSYEIFHEGHINYMIKQLINKHQIAPHVAYRLASYSSAKHFGLKRLGLIAPGKRADIVFIKDIKNVDITEVICGGEFVSELKLQDKIQSKTLGSAPPDDNTILRKHLTSSELKLDLITGLYNVIEIVPHEIITRHTKERLTPETNLSSLDICTIANIERYGKNLRPSLGLVKGFGLKSGALASSVAHDSHNLMVFGTQSNDMALAVNTLIDSGGGFIVVNEGKVLAHVPLPVAGLISLNSAEKLKEGITILKAAFRQLGVIIDEPFIQLAFLALPVIPSLKITDKGLFDVSKFEFINLIESEGESI